MSHEELNKATREFLERGGQVTRVPAGSANRTSLKTAVEITMYPRNNWLIPHAAAD